MLHNFFYSSFLLLVFVQCYAQNFSAVKDEFALRQKITAASKITHSIKCEFTQEKNLNMLTDKLVSKGYFYFRNTGQVRLEYTTPFKYLLVMNNGKISIKDDSKTTQLDVKKNKLFGQINQLVIDCVQGNVLSNPHFKIKISESAMQVKLDMQPTTKNMKEFFSNIVVLMDKKDYTVTHITMNEPSGDNTLLVFRNKTLNEKLADNLFMVAK